MDTTIQELKSRYESMDDWELVDIYRNSELTEIARKVIDEEFQKRDIDPETWEEPIEKSSQDDGTIKEKKKGWKIRSKNDASRVAKEASTLFFVVAAIQAVIGAFLMPSMIFDAVLISILATILRRWKSRIAAIFLFLMSVGVVIVTLDNIVSKAQGAEAQGGGNIILALAVFWASIKSMEAAFKFHGKYAKQSLQENTN